MGDFDPGLSSSVCVPTDTHCTAGSRPRGTLLVSSLKSSCCNRALDLFFVKVNAFPSDSSLESLVALAAGKAATLVLSTPDPSTIPSESSFSMPLEISGPCRVVGAGTERPIASGDCLRVMRVESLVAARLKGQEGAGIC